MRATVCDCSACIYLPAVQPILLRQSSQPSGIIAILRTLVHHDRNTISCLLQYLVCHPSCQLRPQQTQSTVESELSPVDASRRKLRRPPLFSGLTELITQQSNPLEHRLDLVAPSARHRRKRPRIPNFPKNRPHQLATIPSHPAELALPSLTPPLLPPRGVHRYATTETQPTPHSDRKGLCTIPRSVFSTNEPPPSPPHHQATPRLAFHLRSRARPKRCS